MVVSQLWAFAADSFNVKSGQRLFVVIMLGANLGALTGAKITQLLVVALSPIGLMVLATGILGATLFLAGPERTAVPEGSRAISAEHGRPVPRLLGGIGLVLRDRYLLLIALLVVLLNWINTTGEFILADFVKAEAVARVAASGGALDLGTLITAFYGDFQFWVTLVSFSIQLFLVSRIFQAVGVRGALLIHPIIVATGYGVLALAPMLGGFVPIFTLLRLLKIAENGVDYSLMNTTRQALFLPVDRDSKYDGKTAIDTFFVPLRRPYPGAGRVRRPQPPALGRAEVRAPEPGAGVRVDRTGGGAWPWLQPQGPRQRHERGARSGRGHTRPGVFAGPALPAPGVAECLPGRRPG